MLAGHLQTACIDPGKPRQNGTDESLNGKLREEYLSTAEANPIIETWRRHFSGVRPRPSLIYLTQSEFKAKLSSNQCSASRSLLLVEI